MRFVRPPAETMVSSAAASLKSGNFPFYQSLARKLKFPTSKVDGVTVAKQCKGGGAKLAALGWCEAVLRLAKESSTYKKSSISIYCVG